MEPRKHCVTGIESDSITAHASTKRAQTAGREESGADAGTLAHLRRIRYGAKSEALSRSQLSLFEEDWQTDVAAIEAEIEQAAAAGSAAA